MVQIPLPRFELGAVVATPELVARLAKLQLDVARFLARHATCDWGDVSAEDATANTMGMFTFTRLLSVYDLADGGKVYILTEADRSITTVMLATDY